jgi:hypothetical protein
MPLNSNQAAVDCGSGTRPHFSDMQTAVSSVLDSQGHITADFQLCPTWSVVEMLDQTQPDLRPWHETRLLRVPPYAGPERTREVRLLAAVRLLPAGTYGLLGSSHHSTLGSLFGSRKLKPAKPAQMSQVSGSQVEFFNKVSDGALQTVELVT